MYHVCVIMNTIIRNEFIQTITFQRLISPAWYVMPFQNQTISIGSYTLSNIKLQQPPEAFAKIFIPSNERKRVMYCCFIDCFICSKCHQRQTLITVLYYTTIQVLMQDSMWCCLLTLAPSNIYLVKTNQKLCRIPSINFFLFSN